MHGAIVEIHEENVWRPRIFVLHEAPPFYIVITMSAHGEKKSDRKGRRNDREGNKLSDKECEKSPSSRKESRKETLFMGSLPPLEIHHNLDGSRSA